MKYLVISRTEDDVFSEIYPDYELETLKKNLVNEYGSNYEFLNELPQCLDDFPSMSIFIMKGEVVIPKPVKVVKSFELD